MTPSELELRDGRWLEIARRSFRGYLQRCVIDCKPQPRPFGEVAEWWQWRYLFDPILPAVEAMAEVQSAPYQGPTGFWRTMARGSDKTSSIARTLSWLILASRKRVSLRVTAAAADRDQAKKIRDAMFREANLNPWFGRHLKIDKYAATGPGGSAEIISKDASSAFGGDAHVYILDELTHWSSRDLFDALMSGRAKVPGALMFVLTNAGYRDTWQHEVFQEFQAESLKPNPLWDVYESEGVLAGWVDKRQMASDRKTISKVEALRLYDNRWVDATSNPVFDGEDVRAMLDLPTTHRVPRGPIHLPRYVA